MGYLSSKRSDRSDPEETNEGPQYPDLSSSSRVSDPGESITGVPYPDLSSPNRASDPGESITGVPYPDLSAPKVKGPRHRPEAPLPKRGREEPPAVPKPTTRPHGARDSQQRRQKGQRSKAPVEQDDLELQRHAKPDDLVATVRSKAVQNQDQLEQSPSRKPYQAYVEDVDEEEGGEGEDEDEL